MLRLLGLPLVFLTFIASADALTKIRTLSDLERYLSDASATQCDFSVTATFEWAARSDYSLLAFSDSTGRSVIHCYNSLPVLDKLRPGDLVQIDGVTRSNGQNRSCACCVNLFVLSHGTPPPIPDFTIQDFKTGKLNERPCRFMGIVRDVRQDEIDSHWDVVALDCGAHVITLVAWADPRNRTSLVSLVGSTVSGIGLCRAWKTGFRRQRGRTIHLRSLSDLTILKPAPDNPFDVPDLTDAHGLLPRDFESLGPSRIHGTVRATWRGDSILIKTPEGEFARIESIGDRLPAFGERIEAVGYPETDLSQIILSRAQWRPAPENVFTGSQTEASAVEMPVGNGLDVGLNGQTISLRGSVANLPATGENGRFFIQTDGQLVAVDASSVPEALSDVSVGSTVAITGTYVVESENWRRNSALPRITGFFVALRTPADLTVVARPPWWTSARLYWALGILLAVLVAILVWNASLHAMVIRKSRALLKEQAEKLTEKLKVDERTRLAAELHDYHSQNLTAISYQISAARTVCEDDPDETAKRLETAAHMLKSCRTDLRRCLWDLRNDTLNEPDFAEAIRRTVTPVAGTARLSVRFVGRRSQLSDSTAHALLSILRELTANAANHGHAGSIRIAGECRPNLLRFSVDDDGLGFDPAKRLGQDDGHFGLDGIRERLTRLGGTFAIESAPSRGAYIRLTVTPQTSQTLS